MAAAAEASPSLRGMEADQASQEEEEEEEEEEEGEEEEEEEGDWQYDSTWEEEEEEEEEGGQPEGDPGSKASEAAPPAAGTEEAKNREKQSWWLPSPKWASFSQSPYRRNWTAAKDMQKYRQHYPGLEETEIKEEEMWNLSFYKNEIHFLPRGLYIEDLLEMWQNDYATLEENHSYIQWLFPLREQGMNWRARLLTCQEIEAFKKSKQVMDRFVRAYKLMLGFYGIELADEETGELRRAENWRERFENLNRYSHNNLRITRILKCLGEMGYEHYQVHLVKFFLRQTLVCQELPRVRRSTLDYFMFTVRSKERRRELVHFAWRHFKPKREFVWGPRRKLRRFKLPSPEVLSDRGLGRDREPSRKDAGEAEEKNETETPNQVCQRLDEEPTKEGVGEGEEGKDGAELQNQTESIMDKNPSRQPVSEASSELSVSSNDSAPDEVSKSEPLSTIEGDGLQAGDATEPQAGPASECRPSEKTRQPSPPSTANGKVEKGSGQEDAAVSLLQSERKDVADECGSGADGEVGKESKKRKLKVEKLSGESAGLLKSPSDIEKISVNLGEVVIDQEHLEKAKPPLPEGGGGDDRGAKEADSVDAVAKRRKVEAKAPEGGASNSPAKAGVEVAPSEGQVANDIIPTSERTDRVCGDGIEIAGEASVHALTGCTASSVDLLANSKTSTEPGFALAGGGPDKTKEPEMASATEGMGAPPCVTLPANEREVEGSAGEKEGGTEGEVEDAADRKEAAKVEESADTVARPEGGE
ncbi:opioid growth factor receptor isoform X2 [Elgaria multicarinata webbii]|uniref:opioid growth factor receptor isoform X2 n=1 Tax=Elgaria multicarinata webbii TaxID=159646 RepID=UPI002FCD4EF8